MQTNRRSSGLGDVLFRRSTVPKMLRRRQDRYTAQDDCHWRIPCASVNVTAAQLQHRIPCWGYVFQEKGPDGQIESNAKHMPPSDDSTAGVTQRKIVILGDTCDSQAIAGAASNADLLSHEATFGADMTAKARLAQHSTAKMAGEFAKRINAKHLVLTHFSARYSNSMVGSSVKPAQRHQGRAIRDLLAEAEQAFKPGCVSAANDFFTYHVPKQ